MNEGRGTPLSHQSADWVTAPLKGSQDRARGQGTEVGKPGGAGGRILKKRFWFSLCKGRGGRVCCPRKKVLISAHGGA